MPSHILRRLSASTILLGLATPAFAQTSAADDGATSDTIVVTGSRIARPDLQQASPIAIVSAQELKLSGKVNVESIINDLPQLIPSTTAASNNPGGGVSTADLRGLGANRTLVLVDGRRYVSYDSNQIVDLNTVPAGLIDHVEVVSGGRSAVYGSDAIAGVINFVTKRDFSGVEANANYRINQAGDGGTFNTNLLMGGNFADGRGNATFYIDYTKRDAVQQSARSYTKQAYTDDGDGGLAAGGSGSIPGTRFALSGTQYKFNQDGSYSAYDAATDAYNYAPDNYLQVPQKRILLSAQTHYDVNDHLTVYAEGQFINNRVKNRLASTPFTGSVSLDVDSSFLSPESQALLSAADTDGDGYATAAIYRRLNEVGARISNVDNTAYRTLIGAKGQIAGDWNYDGYYSYSRTKQVETQTGLRVAVAVSGGEGDHHQCLFGAALMIEGLVEACGREAGRLAAVGGGGVAGGQRRQDTEGGIQRRARLFRRDVADDDDFQRRVAQRIADQRGDTVITEAEHVGLRQRRQAGIAIIDQPRQVHGHDP